VKKRKVAVVTRTRNRPAFLERAVQSVSSQSFGDLAWIVVNDGGSREPADAAVAGARDRGIEARAIHNDESRGMQAASNQGIEASRSAYVVIHDDDDSWEPGFLAATVGFMEDGGRPPGTRGVATLVTQVEERVEEGSVREIGRAPFRADLRSVSLFEMAGKNAVPPISFLYERSVHDEIGPYREDLPVLGDWEFYMRFLRKWDIEVIPEYLALYHMRPPDAGAADGNSVLVRADMHARYAARIRNEMLRRDLDERVVGMGFIVNIAPIVVQMRRVFRSLATIEGGVRRLPSPARRLIGSLRRVVGS
jgi:glycosyltransferase involved in cell wall biosynthesis